MRTCFFIGHKDAAERYYAPLAEAVERLVAEFGILDFIVGRYGEYDRMAARAVLSVKQRYPDVKLTLLLPYLTDEPLPDGFDGSVYPEGIEAIPRRFTIVYANRAMVRYCDCLVACVHRPTGNARKIYEYAARQGLTIINLCEDTPGNPLKAKPRPQP